MSSVPLPPPPLPPMRQQPLPRRKNWARTAAAVILVMILIVGAGSYLFILGPEIVLTGYTHDPAPMPTTNLELWNWRFNVTLDNSGFLSGRATVVCEYSYENETNITRLFTASSTFTVGGHHQKTFPVNVSLSAIQALYPHKHNQKWNVILQG